MITLSKESFEKFVPSFRDSESRTYEAMLPYMEECLQEIVTRLCIPESFHENAQVEACVYREAAWRALPHMDLIMTDNGFAVVSNSNIAPASRDRVDRLREQLREEKSMAADVLALTISSLSEWRTTPTATRMRSTLLWTPTHCRRYGVTTEDGRQVFQREFTEILSDIVSAQYEAQQLVGEEQMQWMIQNQDLTDLADAGDLRCALVELCRRLMASVIRKDTRGTRTLAFRVLAFLRQNAESLPEYRDSRTRSAHEYKAYTNGKNDPCFFFG